ncbi:MAG TPA: flagellar hook protein [Sulfurimonas sp.]|nr:flagellar hook protein [Sulfurimonas sp.]
MGISSLGAGSSILTQDVIDQLKAADESKFVAPVNKSLRAEDSKLTAYDVMNAYMDNVYESLKSLTSYGVFESRTALSSNENALEVSAKESSDIQDFSIEVELLATKEIEQSGSLHTRDATISTGSGKFELAVGTETFTLNYDNTTTLEGLKELINKEAGDSVNAIVVQVADNDFRLLLSATKTGVSQDISIVDVVGEGETLNTAFTTDMSNVQDGVDAKFKFNGVAITRSSNSVDDLLAGVTLTLKEANVGTKIDVSVGQNREHIQERMTNFIDKYNSAMTQLNTDTKSSQAVSERGVFSSDSTIKGMKYNLVNMMSTLGEGSGKIEDYGIKFDDTGRLTLDSELLNKKLDSDATSTQAFFVGGTFTKDDGSTVELSGAFDELESEVAKYSKFGSILDSYKDSIDLRIKSLNEQKEKAVERLNSNYAIMAKRFAAYDLMINKFNNASDMFTQMINAEITARS